MLQNKPSDLDSKQAITAVHKMADRDPTHDINSYHATLVLAAWTPHGIAAIQVGDGAAIVITEDGPKCSPYPSRVSTRTRRTS